MKNIVNAYKQQVIDHKDREKEMWDVIRVLSKDCSS